MSSLALEEFACSGTVCCDCQQKCQDWCVSILECSNEQHHISNSHYCLRRERSEHSPLVKGLNTTWDERKKEAIVKYIHFEIPEGDLISLSLNAFQSARLNKILQEGKSEELNFGVFFLEMLLVVNRVTAFVGGRWIIYNETWVSNFTPSLLLIYSQAHHEIYLLFKNLPAFLLNNVPTWIAVK